MPPSGVSTGTSQSPERGFEPAHDLSLSMGHRLALL